MRRVNDETLVAVAVEGVERVRLSELTPEEQEGLRAQYPGLPADADLAEVSFRTR